MEKSSGAVSTLGKNFRALVVVKPPSAPGTIVPSSGVLTADAFTSTRTTPFERRTLTPREIIIAFVLYADALLSINQITQRFEAVYDTVHTTIREVEAAFECGFHLVWTHLQENLDNPTQIDEAGQKCSGSKGQTPPRERLSRGGDGDPGRSRWEGAPGDTMTLVGVCRDTLRVIRAERGAKPDELRDT